MPQLLRGGVLVVGRAGATMRNAIARHPKVQVTAAANFHREHLHRFQEDVGGLAFADLSNSQELY
jgi:hypothetical protein